MNPSDFQNFFSTEWDWRQFGGQILVTLVGIATGLLLRWLARRFVWLGIRGIEQPTPRQVMQRFRKPGFLFFPALMAVVLHGLVSTPGPYVGLVNHLGYILIVIGLAWWLVQCIYLLEGFIHYRFNVGASSDNLRERKVVTQFQFLKHLGIALVSVVALSVILLSFEEVRKVGAGILTSAGVLSVIVGFAAQRSIANLLAGFQIAFTHPINLQDAVIVEGDWGRIEEINLTYVVVKTWDWRRLVMPIKYFVEQPFQNWSRNESRLLGAVYLYLDYNVPVEELRQELKRIASEDPLWDGDRVGLQVVDTTEQSMVLRALASGRNSPETWDLRCNIREKLITYLRENHPEALPRSRVEVDRLPGDLPKL